MKWLLRRVSPKEDFCGSHETFDSFWSISLADFWLPGLEKFDSHFFSKSVTKVSSVSSSQGLIIGLYVVNLTPSGDEMGREVCKMEFICFRHQRSLGKKKKKRKERRQEKSSANPISRHKIRKVFLSREETLDSHEGVNVNRMIKCKTDSSPSRHNVYWLRHSSMIYNRTAFH